MLTNGSRLGAYEVVAPLGAGGMGEVYRARDTKLGRDVAIKVVSDGFGHDPERIARFQREAHLLASLNHPHIAAIHGLEEANGSQFLVLELVEGETLAERLKAGPLPVSEALTIARQVADALQAAHEKGIIHRDLKPANIAFTGDGQVKVLDFGLAKALDPEPTADMANSPTMTLGGTKAGVILGTAAYMAPEQAKGRAADKRSDVWAFGCVLYEMLTGKRAFQGEDVSDTIAAVLRGDPDWKALPTDVSPAVRVLLNRCLDKDRNKRVSDVSAALFILTEADLLMSHAPSQTPTGPVARTPLRRLTASGVALLVSALIGGGGVWLATDPASPRVSRLEITPPTSALSDSTIARHLAITPDGTRVIYVGGDGQLFVRRLDTLDATPLAGLGALGTPFVSPDGQWVGFGTPSPELKKVTVAGGPAVPIARIDGLFRGASWASDDTIVFATGNVSTGLQRVGATGGEVAVLTQPDTARGEVDHLWPEVLPGGHAILFTITSKTGGLDQAQVAVLDLATGTQTILVRGGTDARYVSSGHLVYGAAGGLWAVAFDLDRLRVTGTPTSVVPQLVTSVNGAVDVAGATDGTLVYVPGVRPTTAANEQQRTLVWVNRQGDEIPIPTVTPRAYTSPRLSPDGTRVAVDSRDGADQDVWIWDFERQTQVRLTLDATDDNQPVWTPDGLRVVFRSLREQRWRLYSLAADGTGTPQRLDQDRDPLPPDIALMPKSISPDGRWLAVMASFGAGQADIGVIDLTGDRRPKPLIQTRFREGDGVAFSRDGHWIAYSSNESGRTEIYVRPFPDVDKRRWPISTNGGTRPVWSHDGRELFYAVPNAVGERGKLMVVPVKTGTSFSAGTPRVLIDREYELATGGWTYDVSPDGNRFLVMKLVGEAAPPPTRLVVIQHFDEELKRLVPGK